MKKEALRVTSTIPVAPTTLYFAWIDSTHHSSMTGQTAKLDPVVGAKYSCCNGYVTGKLVILDLGRRIVESWRTTDFPRDSADSRVEVHFETFGMSTRILILHTEIPEGQSEKYKALWNERYIAPMRAYFSKFLPDPRNPPVRRVPPPPPEDDDDEVPMKGKGKFASRLAAAKAQKGAVAPKAAPSGPGLRKVDSKSAKPVAPAKAAAKPTPAAKPAPAAKPVAKKPAPVAKKPVPAKKPAPAKKPVAKKPAPAKKPVAKKPTPAKKPVAKKPAPKPAKGKKKR